MPPIVGFNRASLVPNGIDIAAGVERASFGPMRRLRSYTEYLMPETTTAAQGAAAELRIKV